MCVFGNGVVWLPRLVRVAARMVVARVLVTYVVVRENDATMRVAKSLG